MCVDYGFESVKSRIVLELEYTETWNSSGAQAMTIIRFKSIFDADKVHPEIRIVLNEKNKIACL